MERDVTGTVGRSSLLAFFGVVITAVVIGLLVRGAEHRTNLGEIITVLPFGG